MCDSMNQTRIQFHIPHGERQSKRGTKAYRVQNERMEKYMRDKEVEGIRNYQ